MAVDDAHGARFSVIDSREMGPGKRRFLGESPKRSAKSFRFNKEFGGFPQISHSLIGNTEFVAPVFGGFDVARLLHLVEL
jgi:hypothetical protein